MGIQGEGIEVVDHYFDAGGLRCKEITKDQWERSWSSWYSDGGHQIGRTFRDPNSGELVRRLGHSAAPPMPSRTFNVR